MVRQKCSNGQRISPLLLRRWQQRGNGTFARLFIAHYRCIISMIQSNVVHFWSAASIRRFTWRIFTLDLQSTCFHASSSSRLLLMKSHSRKLLKKLKSEFTGICPRVIEIRSVLVVFPSAFKQAGKVMEEVYKNKFTIARLRAIQVSQAQAQRFAALQREKAFE